MFPVIGCFIVIKVNVYVIRYKPEQSISLASAGSAMASLVGRLISFLFLLGLLFVLVRMSMHGALVLESSLKVTGFWFSLTILHTVPLYTTGMSSYCKPITCQNV